MQRVSIHPVRQRLAAMLLAAALVQAASPADAAGIPVIDSASIAERATQHAAEIAKFAEQIAILRQQFDTLSRQYEAITGARNIGDILSNPTIRAALPDDARAILRSGEKATGSIERSTRRILSEERLSGNYPVDYQTVFQRAENLAVRSRALLEQAQTGIQARMEQLDALQAQINMSTDLKTIADLQARLQIEQANIQVDAIRADQLTRELQAERALLDLQAQKLASQSFSIDAIRAPIPE